MQNRRFYFVLALLAVLAMAVLSGCAPRAGSGEIEAPSGLAIDLPAIVIEYDGDGNPSTGDVPLAQLANAIAPGALDSLVLDADTIDFLTASNIQHVQINNRTDGLSVLVNGLDIPSPSWNDESLQATAGLAGTFGLDMPVLEKLLPMVSQLGIGIIAKFPVVAGAEPIPFYVEGEGTSAAAAQESQEKFLAAVETPPTIQIPLHANSDGSWTVAGMSAEQWSELTGSDLTSIRIPPELIQSAAAAGIGQISLGTNIDGIHVMIDGQSLPYVGWSEGRLSNLIELAGQMGMLDGLGGANSDMLALVESLLPVVQTADVSITVFMP